MPIYEYRCKNCGKTTEKRAKSGQQEIICPHCQSTAERIVSVFSTTSTSGNTSGGCLPSSGFS
ncbi:MAG: hypothetical protein C0620_11095 [Desulfuromonas sp.]|nr:MAG: hypothetical protein C0620_11095 [Desulfuromonas sp.]